jgi:hypothetical protein
MADMRTSRTGIITPVAIITDIGTFDTGGD